jgi:5-formyl-3-hydroxy-2-methylpyridine 4-carboxylic acid 5-dehydrogenase
LEWDVAEHERESILAAEKINTVAVVGAGTMGPGMAATFARYGLTTRLSDIKQEQLDKAQGTIDFVYKTLVGGGFMTEADVATAKENLTLTTEQVAAVGDADYVVETVPERLEIKQAVFRELDKQTRPGTVLGSNTSGIPITRLQEGLSKPNRVIGMHWSNPPHLIPVIEVIRGKRTDQATVDTTVGARHRRQGCARLCREPDSLRDHAGSAALAR